MKLKKVFAVCVCILCFVQSALFSKSHANKGEGLSIAVTAPELSNVDENEEWIAGALQNALSAAFVRYSRMTVTDRAAESQIRAEIKRSESGLYSDEKRIEAGRLTNASLIVVGTVQKAGSTYMLSFRVNDIETNEIRAAAFASYTLNDIEQGRAVNGIAATLLSSLGIALSSAEKEELGAASSEAAAGNSKPAVSPAKNAPTAGRAQSSSSGVSSSAVSKDERTITEAAFFFRTTDLPEEIQSVDDLLVTFDPNASIAERAAFYKKQQERWEKVFVALRNYLIRNIPIFVYDFSEMKDEIHVNSNTVTLTFTPGVKVFPRREALTVWKSVMDAWRKVLEDKENEVWTKAVKMPYVSSSAAQTRYDLSYDYKVECRLLDKYGTTVATMYRPLLIREPYYSGNKYGYEVKRESYYFDKTEYTYARFYDVKLSEVTEGMTVQIAGIQCNVVPTGAKPGTQWHNIPDAKVLSVDEWKALLSQ